MNKASKDLERLTKLQTDYAAMMAKIKAVHYMAEDIAIDYNERAMGGEEIDDTHMRLVMRALWEAFVSLQRAQPHIKAEIKRRAAESKKSR